MLFAPMRKPLANRFIVERSQNLPLRLESSSRATGSAKANVDSGFRNLRKASIGFVFRDSAGIRLFAKASQVQASSSLIAKAKALFEAVKIAIDLNLEVVVFHSDCKSLIENLFDCDLNFHHDLLVLCIDLRKLIQGRSFDFCWVPCSANGVAHKLTIHGLSSQSYFTETNPRWLVDFVVFDQVSKEPKFSTVVVVCLLFFVFFFPGYVSLPCLLQVCCRFFSCVASLGL
ncbi:PREDICTED: uncharacterized protein LOC104605410 [Nelumbo nucifera]|uniref:Uncharacterized protein LOC104605410 n=1 Tax=Nelumbo nucifera TaxID=4432 RepID=A0A1U8AM62_NELNU|nr:PREDICTED: uncharacterized protein LOC104605410 [Nelumbo nucifera]